MSTIVSRPVIVWFRRDLRLADNPALTAAAATGQPVIPLYVIADQQKSPFAQREVAAAWNLRNAAVLDRQLADRYSSRLVVRSGDPAAAVLELAEQAQAGAVYCNAVCEPAAEAAELQIRAAARPAGIEFHVLPGNLLLHPGSVSKSDGSPYRVFSPFYRQFLRLYRHAPPAEAPRGLARPASWPESEELSWLLGSARNEYTEAGACWTPGSVAALESVRRFVDERLSGYGENRDRLDIPATSAVSPYLQCGAISARQVWDAVEGGIADGDEKHVAAAVAYQRQLIWREFCYHILAQFPRLPDEPYRTEFSDFPWEPSSELLERWQAGQTGYPVVDAAMRQLAAEGWMPGRARMNVASFLIKHLLQDWRVGEQWFGRWLVDADVACNSFNWQWVAGCGFDAAPYFRIFNPITQGKKFDPDGAYVRRYVPELSALPAQHIHSPWAAPAQVLKTAGVELGRSYPAPVVDHSRARARALSAFHGLKASSAAQRD